MKTSRLDSVAYMWMSFGCIVIATLMMFVPQFAAEGQVFSATNNGGFFGNYLYNGFWPSFVGFMMILAGGIMTAILGLPMVKPSYTGEKLILIIASVLECLGVGLVMTAVVWYCLLDGHIELVTHAGYYLMAGAYLTMIFSLLAIICNVRAILLDR